MTRAAVVIALCLLAAVSTSARPIEGVQRQLLQSQSTVQTGAQLTTLLSTGGSQTDVNSLIATLAGQPPAEAQSALKGAITAAKFSGNTGLLTNALAQVGGQSNNAAAIGSLISGATGQAAPPGTATNADAIGSLLVTAGPGGTASGTVRIDSAATASVMDAVAVGVAEAFANVSSGGNAEAAAKVAALAIGEAVATAFARITGSLNVAGSGTVIADVAASASSIANTTATAIAAAVAKATNGNQNAEAAVAVIATADAVAKALVAVSGRAIQQGPGSTNFDITVAAQDIQQAVAFALAKALAYVSGGGGGTTNPPGMAPGLSMIG